MTIMLATMLQIPITYLVPGQIYLHACSLDI